MLIGITGGIGSGKSRVAAYWARCFQLERIDLDAICRELLKPGQPGWLALKESHNYRFFTIEGLLDRQRFRAELFSDQVLRDEIDAMLHPLARAQMHRQYLGAKKYPVLVEIPLLFEAGWEQDVDRIVVVYASQEIRCNRIVHRDKVSIRDAEQAMSIQWPLRRKIKGADHCIDNSASWFHTCMQVMHLGRHYAKMLAGKKG